MLQALIRQAAQPAVPSAVSNCCTAVAAAAGQSSWLRHFATAPSSHDAARPAGSPEPQAASPPQQQGQQPAPLRQRSKPHEFGEPYAPDIRHYVYGRPNGLQPRHSGYAAISEQLPALQLDLVQQYLSEENASLAEQRNAQLQQVMRDFQRFEGDTGSSEVQVARLTARISQLAEHMRTHRKDFASRRGLEACIAQRRNLLTYLRRTEFTAYAHLIARLGLRDTYGKLDRITLQIQERRTRGPSKPRKPSRSRKR